MFPLALLDLSVFDLCSRNYGELLAPKTHGRKQRLQPPSLGLFMTYQTAFSSSRCLQQTTSTKRSRGSPYDGGVFDLKIQIPEDYPFRTVRGGGSVLGLGKKRFERYSSVVWVFFGGVAFFVCNVFLFFFF